MIYLFLFSALKVNIQLVQETMLFKLFTVFFHKRLQTVLLAFIANQEISFVP